MGVCQFQYWYRQRQRAPVSIESFILLPLLLFFLRIPISIVRIVEEGARLMFLFGALLANSI